MISKLRSGAEDPGRSPWDDFLERPVEQPERKSTPARRTKPTAVSVIDRWTSKTAQEAAASLSDAEKRYKEAREAAFKEAGKFKSDPAILKAVENLEKYRGANRAGGAAAFYEAFRLSVERSDMSGTSKRDAIGALKRWKKGMEKLEKRVFKINPLDHGSGKFHEQLVDYGKEVAKHLPNVVLPELDVLQVLGADFAERYAPVNLMGSSSLFEEPEKTYGVSLPEGLDEKKVLLGLHTDEEIDNRAINMKHPGGLQCGLILPEELRVSDLNETEKKYVKADYLASAASRNAAVGIKNLSIQALQKYGLRARVASRSRGVASQSRLYSGNKDGNDTDDDDDDDDDDLFYDVYEEDDEEFFDVLSQEEPETDGTNRSIRLTDEQADSVLNLLGAIDGQKREIGGLRTIPLDPVSEYLMRENTDLRGLMRLLNDHSTEESMNEQMQRFLQGRMEEVHRHVDNTMMGVSFQEEGQFEYVRETLHRTVSQFETFFNDPLSDGVLPEDRSEVRDSISSYLSLNATTRIHMLMETIYEAFQIDPKVKDETQEATVGSDGQKGNFFSAMPTQKRPRTTSTNNKTKEEEEEKKKKEEKNENETWLEFLSGLEGAKFLEPKDMVANLVLFLAPLLATGGLMAMTMDLTQSPLKYLTQAMTTGAAVVVAGRATEEMLLHQLKWAESVRTSRESLRELWDKAASKFVELKKEKDERVTNLNDGLVQMIDQLGALMNFSSKLVAAKYARFTVANKMRAENITLDRILDHARKVNRRSPQSGVAASEAINSFNATAHIYEEGSVCAMAGDLLAPIEAELTRRIVDAQSFSIPLKEGDEFLDDVITPIVASAIEASFSGCGSHSNVESEFKSLIDNRASLREAEGMLEELNTFYKIQSGEVPKLEAGQKMMDFIKRNVSMDDNTPTPAQLSDNLTRESTEIAGIADSVRNITAQIDELRELKDYVKNELEEIADPRSDTSAFKALGDKFNDLQKEMDKSLDTLSKTYSDRHLAFFKELQRVTKTFGSDKARDLYKNARDMVGLDAVVSDGRPSIAVFDETKDEHFIFVANNISHEDMNATLHNAQEPNNARLSYAGEDKKMMSGFVTSIFDVLSNRTKSGVTDKQSYVDAALDEVNNYAANNDVKGVVVENARNMARTAPGLYTLPVKAVELSGGKVAYYPTLKPLDDIDPKDFNEFVRNGTRNTLLLNDLGKTLEGSNTESVLSPENTGEEAFLVQTLETIGYWNLLITSCAKITAALATLVPTAMALIAHVCCWSYDSEKDDNTEAVDISNAEVERNIRAMSDNFAAHIGLVNTQYRHILTAKSSRLERVQRANLALSTTSFQDLLTSLFVEAPAGARRIRKDDSMKASFLSFLKAHPWLVVTRLAIVLLGVGTIALSPSTFVNSAIVNWTYSILSFPQTLGLYTTANWTAFSIGGGVLGVGVGGATWKYWEYSKNLSTIDMLKITKELISFIYQSVGASSLSFYLRGGYYLLRQLFNPNLLFFSVQFALHFSQSNTDAFYFGTSMIFRMALPQIASWMWSGVVDIVTFVYHGLGYSYPKRVRNKFVEEFNKFNNKMLDTNNIDTDLFDDTTLVSLLSSRSEDGFWTVVTERGIIDAYTPAEKVRREILSANETEFKKIYKTQGYKLVQATLQKLAKVYRPSVYIKIVGSAILSILAFQTAMPIFNYMQEESMKKLESQAFKEGVAVFFNSTLGAAAQSSLTYAGMVTKIPEMFDVDFDAVEGISGISDVLRENLTAVSETLLNPGK